MLKIAKNRIASHRTANTPTHSNEIATIQLFVFSLFSYFSSEITIRGVQTRPGPVGLTNPPDLHPSSARIDTPIGQFRVSASKTRRQWIEWRVFFSKIRATDPMKVIYKSDEITLKSEVILLINKVKVLWLWTLEYIYFLNP